MGGAQLCGGPAKVDPTKCGTACAHRPGQFRDSRTCKQKQRRRVISINLSIKKYAVNKCMWHELMPHAGTPEGSEENVPSGQ